MSLIAIIVVGLIAGWLASAIMKTNTGLLLDLVLGVIGAIVGGWISSLITGVNLVGDINLTSIVVSLLKDLTKPLLIRLGSGVSLPSLFKYPGFFLAVIRIMGVKWLVQREVPT